MPKTDKPELDEKTLEDYYQETLRWGPSVPVYVRFRAVIDALRATRQELATWQGGCREQQNHNSELKKRITELEQQSQRDRKRITELETQLRQDEMARRLGNES